VARRTKGGFHTLPAFCAFVGVGHRSGTLLALDPPPPAWQGVDGTRQTIGLLEYDSYDASDLGDCV